MIALVIEARQMQYAVQHQNLHLVRCRMPESPGIFSGNIRGNRNVSGDAPISGALRQRQRKR